MYSFFKLIQELENVRGKEETIIRQNNRDLEKAKIVGYEMEGMAGDIKVELNRQTNKMKNTLGNLYNIQGELTLANRLMLTIKQQRLKNKIILYSVFVLLVLALCYIVYNAIF